MEKLQQILTLLSELPYMVKSSLILCLLFGAYVVHFSKGTYFHANRIFLIGTMVMSVGLPLVSINAFPILVKLSSRTVAENMTPTGTNAPASTYFYILLIAIYFIGLIWMLYQLIRQVNQIVRTILTANIQKKGHVYFVADSGLPISSFFNYIFIPTRTIDPIMLDHEKIHIDKKHTIDVLLASVFRCMFWFHPLSHALLRRIKLNHEFECDALMSSQYSTETYAQHLFSHAQSVGPNSVINQFYSFTKKRIIMMSHLQNQQKSGYNYLWMLPIFILVFVLFSFRKYHIIATYQADATFAADTLPQSTPYMDTIIRLDPITLKETIELVPATFEIVDTVEYWTMINGQECKSQIIQKHEFPKEYYLTNIDQMIDARDTIITLDSSTMKESIKVATYKISKIYKELIDNELEKPNPNFKLIEKWTTDGKRDSDR